MSPEARPSDITELEAVYRMPGMEAVVIRRDIEYRAAAGTLSMDIYAPPAAKPDDRRPAVVFVLGYPDAGFLRMFGCRQKDMGSYVSWGRLIAASGLTAIACEVRDPAADTEALLRHLRTNAASLGIDEARIGLWACSGNVPNALSVMMRPVAGSIKCAVLCYGYMLDVEGTSIVADAARKWGFVNPGAGRTVDDLAPDVPLFIARAGRDANPGLNETIDRFLAEALTRNQPLTFVNLPDAPHAFDLTDDREASRETIRQILAFMRDRLR
jgi:hypothetical protein